MAVINLKDAAKKNLLEIARKSVEAAVRGEPVPHIVCDDAELQKKLGVFVTIKTYGQLRGCIGCFYSNAPLYQSVSDMAISSATDDSRFEFNRIKPDELNSLEIEISVLSALKPMGNPLDFELGKEGIYIKKGLRTGCFLPQVAAETGWNKEEFLSHCCASKAGLPADAWKFGDVEIYSFTAEILRETARNE